MPKKKLLFLLAVCLLLAACQGTRKGEQKTSVRIGISLYRADDTFINNLQSIFEAKAKEYEQENGIKVILDIQDAKGSQNVQNSQVERFISLGCDVLCINPVDRMDASAIIDMAMTAGVPVVFFNRQPVEEDMNRWDQLYYIGVDAKETAILQGKMVVDLYKEQPEAVDLNGDGVVGYVLLEGETSHQDSLIRTEWSIRTLKNGGVPIEKITGGIANWERSQGSALMEQWLSAYPGKIELVVSNNDDGSHRCLGTDEDGQSERHRDRRNHARPGGFGKRKTAGYRFCQQGTVRYRNAGNGSQLCAGRVPAGRIPSGRGHLLLDAAGNPHTRNQENGRNAVPGEIISRKSCQFKEFQ